jgi:hypothetical protein
MTKSEPSWCSGLHGVQGWHFERVVTARSEDPKMATTNHHTRRQSRAKLRKLVKRYRGAATALVEGIAMLLRLPLVIHVLVNVVVQLVISRLSG